MKKRLLSILLAVAMLLLCVPAGAIPTVEAETTEDGFVYSIENEGAIITRYTGSATELVIPDTLGGYPVTSIGEAAFYNYNCSFLTSITIPDSVTIIGYEAFFGCISLTSITVAESNPVYHSADNCIIETATKALIQGCKNSVIPDDGSVTRIGAGAFSGYGTLTSITIPDSVTSIGNDAFSYCDSLAFITIPDSVTSIGNSAFADCGSLTSVTIGNGVTSIGEYVFAGCSSLTSITIPDSVTSIGDYAFSYCKLTDVYYGGCGEAQWSAIVCGTENDPLMNATIHYEAHDYVDGVCMGCGDILVFTTEDGFVYSIENEGAIITDYTGSATELVIPDALGGYPVTSIGDRAFSECFFLTSITIPDGVTSIGERAFYDCDSLTSITIPDSVTSIGNGAFLYCDALTSITIPDSVTSIGASTFDFCSALTSITIPDSVTSIGGMAFYNCNALTSITIPDSVTSIGNYAFLYCSSLTSLTIGDGVTSIGEMAFGACYSLTDVYYGGCGEAQWSAIVCGTENDPLMNATIHYEAHDYVDGVCTVCGDAQYYTYTVTDGKATITHYAGFESMPIIPSTLGGCPVTAIGDNAFSGQGVLHSITIPDGVISIGSRAFSNGTSLAYVAIPDSVTSIGASAFYGCELLTWITIGDGVTSIGNSAFADCTDLTDVHYCGTQAEWNAIAIGSGNEDLTDATIHYEAHTWRDATCTAPITCIRCGETEGEALGHDWTDATCTDPETCVVCGATQGEALGHDWNDATCTTPVTCTRCGETEGEALGHDWTDATCTTSKTCTVCGATGGAALGHDWQDATCTTPITCAACGMTEGVAHGHDWKLATCTAPITCAACGMTRGEALGHTWVEATCAAPKTCTTCGETEGELGHIWQAATCTQLKTCTTCGATEGEALGHDWDEATCTAPVTCARCGETEKEALGHDWQDATCATPITCARCGETEGKALGHTWQDATCTERAFCTTCGAHYSDFVTIVVDFDGRNLTANSNETAFAVKDDTAILDGKYLFIDRGMTGDVSWSQLDFAATGKTDEEAVVMYVETSTTAGLFMYFYDMDAEGAKRCLKAPAGAEYYLVDADGNIATKTVATTGTFNFTDGTAPFKGWLVIPFSSLSLNHWNNVSDQVPTSGAFSGMYAGCTGVYGATFSIDNIGFISSIESFIAAPFTIVRANGGEAMGHAWQDATCTTPKTCSRCNLIEGAALGHVTVDATCVSPVTCIVCGETEGEALGHTWQAATCTTPKTCTTCGATEGELGHNWQNATCTTPKTCTVCGETEGELGHDWQDATCATPRTCTVCGATGGEALGHIWVAATCTAPAVCQFCAMTRGEALGHDYVGGICTRCGDKDDYIYTVTDGKATITRYTGSATELILPDILDDYPVTCIGAFAFESSNLVSAIIPDGVVSIEHGAFSCCTSLTSITIPESVTSIGDGAFYACDSLTSITIPANVTRIGTGNGNGVFEDCESLTSITIPESVTSIGKWTFYSCDSLTNVYYGGTQEQWEAITIEGYNDGLLKATVHYKGHTWTDATCTAPKTCTVCGETEGEALGHDYADGVCTRCGAEDPDVEEPTPDEPDVPSDTEAQLVIGSVVGKPGSTVKLTFTVQNAPGIKALALTGFTYDSDKLELVSGEWAQLDSIIASWDAEKQSAAIVFKADTDINTAVFTLTFTIKEGAAFGPLPVSCQVVAKTKADGVETDLAMTVTAGTVLVGIPGDMDGNEVLDTDDATYLLFHTLLPDLYPLEQGGDIDGNGAVDSDDAVYLLFHILLPDIYPIG